MWWHAKCFGHTRDVAGREERLIDDSWTARTATSQTASINTVINKLLCDDSSLFFCTSILFFCCCCFSSSSLCHHHKRLCTFTYYCILTCNNNYITLSYIYIHRSVKQNKFIYIDAFKLEYGKLFNIPIDLYT